MGKLFNENFCTNDYDQEIVDYIEDNFGGASLEYKGSEGYLKYGEALNRFWTSGSPIHCRHNILTKQQFKEKIGMIGKAEEKDNMASYKLIDKEGFLKESAANSSILEEIGSDIFTGQYLVDCLVGTNYEILISSNEFRFFEKVGNNTPAEPITEPVAESEDTSPPSPYQHLIDDCEELDINLVVTGEGLHILDCINSVEYKIEEPDDYQKIVDAMRLLQNKEMG